MRKLLYLGAFLILTSCALCQELHSIQHKVNINYCNNETAYDRGFNAGKELRDVSTEFVNDCEAQLQTSIRESYRQGYKEGAALGSKKSEPTK